MFNHLYIILTTFWYPLHWFSFDFLILEILILYFYFLLFFEKNTYNMCFYSFILFLLFGIFMCFIQVDVMVGFFWLSELTIFFVFLVTLISINTGVLLTKSSFFYKNIYFFGLFSFFLTLFILPISSVSGNFVFSTNVEDFYIDFYESLQNYFKTDLFGLFLTYYSTNSFEFLAAMFLILIVSMIIVQLNSFISIFQNRKNFNDFYFISFFSEFFDFFFLRRQDLGKQTRTKPSYKYFQRKKK